MNISSIFIPSLAEVSKNLIPSPSANALASCRLTCLCDSKSFLFPTKIFTTFSLQQLSTSPSQFCRSSNDFLSVMSQVRITPCAPLQQAEVIVLNFSCPAVSHIFSLTTLPSASKALILKSTPMVGKRLSMKMPSAKRTRRLDLPTVEFPMRRILSPSSYCITEFKNLLLSSPIKLSDLNRGGQWILIFSLLICGVWL